ncbi:DUF1904 family protein [Paenibacillus sp. GCM10012307]|uniref:DUF1904 family protein n=1 Tax=Paenibacillus roseus TaxID=2798579 RepID=A0A934JAP6_9BACL|nr:DUF1904 family protein [Paenibacillus roseus]MBJ6363711.1 DUF1904 family protein [Paenibacillus roseus]
MPQLTVRGIDKNVLITISKPLLKDMAQVCGCGTDNFTIDRLEVTATGEEGVAAVYPFIEVAWFERGRHVRDELARTITMHVRSAGVEELEIAFKVYREDGYYINGVSCAAGTGFEPGKQFGYNSK